MKSKKWSVVLLVILSLVSLHPAISSAVGLMLGLAFGLLFTHPYPDNKVMIHRLLSASIIGIGAGMNLAVVAKVGLSGVGYTLLGICLTMMLGLFLGRFFKISDDLSVLISAGTAICGGSAIAALSSALRSKPVDVSTALIVIFLLNSVALFVFPVVGHHFQLTEPQFGLWSALAIHDTSSVVGASLRFGHQAVEIGTLVKLARALWIIPLTFAIRAILPKSNTGEQGKPYRPWFMVGFLAAAALVTWVPELKEPGDWVAAGAKRLFVLTLFWIGTSFSRDRLKALSVKPLIQAVILWIVVAVASLEAIRAGWVKLDLGM